MKMPGKIETRASMIAKDILKETDNDWLATALRMFAMAKDDQTLLRDIVDPIIGNKIYEELEYIAPINFNGKSLLTCPLSTSEYILLRDAGKADLDKEIAYIEENLQKVLERAAWFHHVSQQLGEQEKVRDHFTVQTLGETRKDFEQNWDREVRFFISNPYEPIKKLALEAIQKSGGDWMMALQMLTNRVLEDPQALYYLTAPEFFSPLWQILGSVSEHNLNMAPPMNTPLSSGWIFGDSTPAELKQEIINWEKKGKSLLRKLRWLTRIREAIGETEKVYRLLSEPHVKKFWNDAYLSVR